MEDFDTLMKQAVSIKTGQMLQKRRKFEVLPLFIKAGLYYLVKFANVRRQGFYQRYAVSDHLKARGNKLFKEEKVEEATREYEQALSILRYIVNKNPNWKNEGIIDEDLEYINYNGENEEEYLMATSIKVAIYNNLAACYLNLKDYSNAKAACDETLLLDPTQTKALYRRSKAVTSNINAGVEEYKAAIEDLKRALELAPEDAGIIQALNKAKVELAKAKSSSQAFKGIFNKNDKKSIEEVTQQIKKEDIVEKVQPLSERKVDPKDHSLSQTNQGLIEPKKETIPKKDERQRDQGKNGQDITKKERDREENKTNKGEEPLRKENKNKEVKREGNIDKNNEVWKMLHGDKDPNSGDYDYSLSYEKKESAEVPTEIAELEKFLEKRGNELLRLYETSGKTQQAQELRENLRKAMAAKQRLEKIATLDFEKPNSQLRETADKFGLDLNDPAIREELKRVQNQNLEDIKNWINGMGPEGDKTDVKEKSKKNMKPKNGIENASPGATITNNYFINNNYYSSSKEPVSKTKIVENIKEQHDQYTKSVENNKLLSDLVENVNKLNETDTNSKVARIMNLVIAAIAIGLFLISLYMQTNRGPSSGVTGRPDVSKEI